VTENPIRQALQDSVDEVLEKMFFVETQGECAEPAGDPAADEIAVELTFQGEPPGALLLRLTSPAARQIAADFLGIDEAEVSGVRTSEVVRELANMICGAALSRARGQHEFRLGEPRCPGLASGSDGPPDAAIAVTAGDGLLEAELRLESGECSQSAKSAS